MISFKCDRCGKPYELAMNRYSLIYSADRIVSGSVYRSGKFEECTHYDLCPDCKSAFNRWVKGEQND